MNKKYGFLIMFVFFLCVPSINAQANLKINSNQYKKLISLGINDFEINALTSEEIENITKLEKISEETKFFKTVYFYDNDINFVKDPMTVVSTEISKKEYINSKQEMGLVAFDELSRGYVNTPYYETSYKKLTMYIYNSIDPKETVVSGYLEWKIPPKIRNHDIFAIRTENKIIKPNNKIARSYASYTSNNPFCDNPRSYTYSVYYNEYHSSWNLGNYDSFLQRYNGVGITYNKLHPDMLWCHHSELGTPIVEKTKLSSRLWVRTSSPVANRTENIYLTYQHATRNLNLSNIRKSYSFISGSLGNVINFNNGYNQYYDNMNGVKTSYYSR